MQRSIQLFENKFGHEAATSAWNQVNQGGYNHPDAPLDGNKIRAAVKHANEIACGFKIEAEPLNFFEDRIICDTHVLFKVPDNLPNELASTWKDFKQKAAAALEKDRGTAKFAETLKFYDEMSEVLVRCTENYQKTSEKLMDPLFEEHRFNEKSAYWFEAMECIFANKKEEAVAYKQAAERMDRFLDLKIEATSSRNQYRNNDINVSCAAHDLVKLVEARTLKIDLIKFLAKEAPGSKVTPRLYQALAKTDRAITFYEQAAELREQGNTNQDGQDGHDLSCIAEKELMSAQELAESINLKKTITQR